jgi:hypothetical protein
MSRLRASPLGHIRWDGRTPHKPRRCSYKSVISVIPLPVGCQGTMVRTSVDRVWIEAVAACKAQRGRVAADRGLSLLSAASGLAHRGPSTAAPLARGAVVALGSGLVHDGRVTLTVTGPPLSGEGTPRRLRQLTVPAVEIAARPSVAIPSFVVSRDTATELGLPSGAWTRFRSLEGV